MGETENKGRDDKDKIIALQRKQIEKLCSKVTALEQEIALLEYEKKQFKKSKKRTVL